MLDSSVAEPVSPILRDIYIRDSIDSHVVATHGYNISVSVKDSQLVISDGVGGYRRVRKFPKVDR